MKILFLEPFFGGSHKDFAKGFAEYSTHEVDLITLPPRFWKWRMRGASLYFMDQIEDVSQYDLVFATDMMDLADFKALAGSKAPPMVIYFHENQLSYPLGPHEKRDFHLGFTNIVSAHVADKVIFNSQFHRDEFLRAARKLIKQMPDFRPVSILDRIEAKARVIYPGCCFPADRTFPEERLNDPPIIVWNHRWEYDKNPEGFFRAVRRLKQSKVPFSLVVLGEQYEILPDIFKQAKTEFKEEILAWGYEPVRETYESWLKKGDVVVSTAIQENFGISVVEAVGFGCFPLLPNRLSYPEILPEKFHAEIIYGSDGDLFEKLKKQLLNLKRSKQLSAGISHSVERFSWEIIVKQYDNALEK